MPTKSRSTKKSAGVKKAAARKNGKGRGNGKGGMTVSLPKSMVDVLQFMGARVYEKFGIRNSKLNPKYAEPICLALSDGDVTASEALQKRMLRAHRDFAGVGLKVAP